MKQLREKKKMRALGCLAVIFGCFALLFLGLIGSATLPCANYMVSLQNNSTSPVENVVLKLDGVDLWRGELSPSEKREISAEAHFGYFDLSATLAGKEIVT